MTTPEGGPAVVWHALEPAAVVAQLTTDPELVERGQLTALYDPDSI